MKKLTAIITAGLTAMAVSATAFAASLINVDEARAIAEKQVPAGISFVTTKAELNKIVPYYEVKFYDEANHTEYEIDVLQTNGAIKEYSMDAKALFGSSKITLNTNDVQALVLKDYPQAVFHKIELDRDNGLYEYEVKFTAPGLRGKYTVNPETGVVMEKELKYQF